MNEVSPPTENILTRAGKAAAWMALGNWVSLLIGLVSLAVIARILGPEAYGIFGISLVILVLPEVFSGGTFSDALIQRKTLKDGHIGVVLSISSFFAFSFWGVIAILAPFIATILKQPVLAPILYVFPLVLSLSAFMSIPVALLQRDLRFKAISAVDMCATIAASCTAIILAFNNCGVWTLVVMEIVRRTIKLIGFSYLARWIPNLKFSSQDFRDILNYNFQVLLYRLVEKADNSLPRFLIGSLNGPAALGIFNLAFRLQEQTKLALVSPMGAVSLPVASQIRHKPIELHRVIETAMKVSALIAYPAFIGIAAISEVLIPFIFGPSWNAAIVIVQLAMLIGLRAPMAAFNSGILRGIGRPDMILGVSVAGLSILCLLLPFTIRSGLFGIVISIGIAQFVTWFLGAIAVNKTTGLTVYRQMIAGSVPLIAALIMGICVWYCASISNNWMPPIASLPLLGILGVCIYTLVLKVLDKSLASAIINFLNAAILGKFKIAMQSLNQLKS